MDFDRAREIVNGMLRSVSRVVVGKSEMLKHIIASIVAGGHVLIEGPPGAAKTLIAKSIAKAIGGEFARVQGNPDILPTDLTGYYIHSLNGSSKFVKGPIFTNILMFDELNRTPPRVQSALLQAMAEMQVSIDGVVHEIPKPFHVIATETPVEVGEVGIYPLTLTLRDRFWIRCKSMYNPIEEEMEIVKRGDKLYTLDVSDVETVTSLEEFLNVQSFVSKGIYVDDRVVKYIVDIVSHVRSHKHVRLGPSHRGSIYLYRVAKVIALLSGRDYVVPDDVKEIAVEVLSHRILLTEEAIAEGVSPEKIVLEALEKVEVPKE